MGGPADGRQVRHQPLSTAILLPELAQLPELAHPQGDEALSPAIEALLADAKLAADLSDPGAGFRLAQRHRDLLVGELARRRAWTRRSSTRRSGENGKARRALCCFVGVAVTLSHLDGRSRRP